MIKKYPNSYQISGCSYHKKNVNISIGDEVITSGYSDIYPSGLPVGKVAGVIDKRGSFHKNVTVSLPNDLSVFQHAFVIIGRND